MNLIHLLENSNKSRKKVVRYLQGGTRKVGFRIFSGGVGKRVSYLLCATALSIITVIPMLSYKSGNIQQVAITSFAPPDCSKQTGIEKVICLAEAFKSVLTPDQLALVQLTYSKADAVRWSNFPQQFSRPNRVGISLGSLNATQLAAAKSLMAAVLASDSSNEGFEELEGILAADDYFGKISGQTGTFGAGNFYLAFLGKPGKTDTWELQFGGHHYAFADTYKDNKITGVTPSFRGVEPMAPVTAGAHSYQPMEQERRAFHEIWQGLNDAEKKSASLPNTFSDLLLGPGQDGKFPNTRQGVKITDLNSSQQKQIIKAIELYVNDLDAATAKETMLKYAKELRDTYLAYSGSGSMNKTNDYVRLDGPSIWIEYSVQPSRDFPNTTHPHSVWRDRKTDYGGN